MGTAKRERQKQNRQQRQQQIQKFQARRQTKRRGLVIGGFVAALLLVAVIIAIVGGGDDGDDEATTGTTVAGATTLPGETTVAGATTLPGETTVAGATTVPGETTVAGATTVAGPTTVPGAALTGATPCPAADGSSPRTITFAEPPPMCIDPAKSYTAEVETTKGSFTMELNTANAPETVNNFVVLSRYHYYDGVSCHRIIAEFAIQCGDPTGTGGGPNPGYNIPDELPAAGEYKDGTVAMANTGQPNTGGGQFFIVAGAEGAGLPPQYSILGEVTEGYDTTVAALEAAADPNAANGVPTAEPVFLLGVTITEA